MNSSKKTQTLVVVLILLLGIAGYRFLPEWLRPPMIEVSISARPGRGTPVPGQAMQIIFGFDQEYAITKVRVTRNSSPSTVSSSGTKTLQNATWELLGSPHSEKQRGISYGDEMAGMKIVHAAEPLVPGESYRIELESGRAKGSRIFQARAEEE